MAKHCELGPDDVIVTVATDGHEMYRSELQRYLKRRHNTGELTSEVAAEIVGQHLLGADTEHVLDATAARARAHLQPRLLHLGRAAGHRACRFRPAPLPGLLARPARAGAAVGRDDHRLQPRQRHGRGRLTQGRGETSAHEHGNPGHALPAAAQETLARDRGLREKVMSLEEAAKLVHDGDHVGIGGCTMSRTPHRHDLGADPRAQEGPRRSRARSPRPRATCCSPRACPSTSSPAGSPRASSGACPR